MENKNCSEDVLLEGLAPANFVEGIGDVSRENDMYSSAPVPPVVTMPSEMLGGRDGNVMSSQGDCSTVGEGKPLEFEESDDLKEVLNSEANQIRDSDGSDALEGSDGPDAAEGSVAKVEKEINVRFGKRVLMGNWGMMWNPKKKPATGKQEKNTKYAKTVVSGEKRDVGKRKQENRVTADGGEPMRLENAQEKLKNNGITEEEFLDYYLPIIISCNKNMYNMRRFTNKELTKAEQEIIPDVVYLNALGALFVMRLIFREHADVYNMFMDWNGRWWFLANDTYKESRKGVTEPMRHSEVITESLIGMNSFTETMIRKMKEVMKMESSWKLLCEQVNLIEKWISGPGAHPFVVPVDEDFRRISNFMVVDATEETREAVANTFEYAHPGKNENNVPRVLANLIRNSKIAS